MPWAAVALDSLLPRPAGASTLAPMTADPGPAPGAARERVLTWPLGLFLLAVAAVVGYGFWHKYPRPDLDGGIWLLADGDLDGAERIRMLRRVLAQAEHAETAAHRWAGLMAAVALEDRAAFARFGERIGLGGTAPELPLVAEREPIGLGDPVLASLFAAMVAEIEHRPVAKAWWAQVAAQARLTCESFVAELAVAALQRLR